jgi:tetratricopeptide (TPR) repeat protein
MTHALINHAFGGMPRVRLSCKILTAACLALGASGCSPKAKIDQILEGAKTAYEAGDYDKAKAQYVNVFRVDAKNSVAMRQLGLIWFEEGAPLKALPFLRRAIELEPNDRVARSKIAVIYLGLGDRAQAKEQAFKILDQSPHDDEALIMMADAAATKEEMAEAEKELAKQAQPDRAAIHLAMASLTSRRGDDATAETEIGKALGLEPKSVTALLAKATYRIAKKDAAGAEEALRRAAELSPMRSGARVKLAEFLALKGESKEAEAILKEITEKAPDYVPAWRIRAEMAFAEKRYDDGLALLDKVFLVDPSNLDGRMLQAQIVLGKKDYKKAVSLLEDLHHVYPKLPTVMFELGRAHMLNEDFHKAHVALTEAVTANPNYVDAVLLLGQVKLRLGDLKGDALLMRGLLKKAPKMITAQLQLGEALRGLGQHDDAAAIYREQIKDDPQNPAAYLLLGSVLQQKGANAEARDVFTRAQELRPDDLLPIYQLVKLDLQAKDFTSAHQRIAAQLQKQSDSGGAMFLQGTIYAAEKNWDKAEAALLKSIELRKDATSAYNELIGVYIAAGKLPEAAAQLETLLAKNPKDVRVLMTLATVQEKLKDFAKARDAYEKILSLSPDFVPAMNNLAALDAQQLNQIDKAYDLASKARTLKGDDASVADTLGWITYKKGDYPRAVELLKESGAKLPDDAEIQFHLGMAAYMMGQYESARPALKKAVESASNFQGKGEARARLALLENGHGGGAPVLLADLEAALQKQPDDLLLQTRVAEAYERQGVFEKAADAYEKALHLNPKLASAAIKLAELYHGRLRNPAKAAEFGQKARELAPNDPHVAGVLGALAYSSGDFAKAYGLLRESAGTLPNDADVLHDLAWAAYSQGKVDEARKTMQQLLAAAANSPHADDAKTFLALTAPGQNPADLAGLAPQADAILRKDSHDVPALMVKAMTQMQQGETKAAEDICTSVLQRFPDFAPAQKCLAQAYVNEPANYEKGYDLAVKARKTLSDDADLARILGVLAYHRHEFSYAAQLFAECARKQSLDVKSLYYFGRSLVEAKQTLDGKVALEKSLSGGLQEPMAGEAKAILGGLAKK